MPYLLKLERHQVVTNARNGEKTSPVTRVGPLKSLTESWQKFRKPGLGPR
jgi:hypothetical protein